MTLIHNVVIQHHSLPNYWPSSPLFLSWSKSENIQDTKRNLFLVKQVSLRIVFISTSCITSSFYSTDVCNERCVSSPGRYCIAERPFEDKAAGFRGNHLSAGRLMSSDRSCSPVQGGVWLS